MLAHQDLAYAVALRMLGDADEAREVAQDAFVRAWRAIGSFRGDAKFSTWLVAILINLCRNRRRSWARQRQVTIVSLDAPGGEDDDPPELQVADASPDPSVRALRAEQRKQITAAIAMLDDDSREVIVLRDMQGLAYEDIARSLACELGTVKSRLARARGKLRSLLDGKLE